MMRSMFSGVSGLRNHQIRMDVIGNNIANVNTTGFKSGSVQFSELFSQTMRGASASQGQRSGTNPMQVGLGVTIASISQNWEPGNMQVTGKATDLAIDGDGFFILNNNGTRVYTRAGMFEFGPDGYLANPDGLRVMGWNAVNGSLDNAGSNMIEAIRIPTEQAYPASATTTVRYGNNLDASAATGTTKTTTVDVYDSLGNLHALTITFEKTGDNEWEYTIVDPDGTPIGATQTIEFNSDGQVDQTNHSAQVSITFTPPGGASALNIDIDFTQLTQFAGESTVDAVERDGYAMGELDNITIDSNGVITGTFSNGLTQPLAQIALANFTNAGGLLNLGGSIFGESNNSGLPQIGLAGTSGRGSILPSTLEMSNVDLSQEFTNMIITQRGFQANSRVITTSDEMLHELANLKR